MPVIQGLVFMIGELLVHGVDKGEKLTPSEFKKK